MAEPICKSILSDLLLFDILALLQKVQADATYTEECAPLAAALQAGLRNRMAGNSRKGNAKGGPGAPSKWYVVEDEELGWQFFKGVAALAVHFNIPEKTLRGRLANGGGKWHNVAQRNSGEWAVTVRPATAQEAAELAEENGETEK
jgi:hypothetical protein